MISTKKHIQQLAAILLAKGITNIVISPGSRSGPLVHTLATNKSFNCRSIVDERSAGYFAIGLSESVQKPVVLVCSSGTSTLNYAPAVAEAFYRNIPLMVLTADRPPYWIDQLENQTIRQNNIYRDFIKKEITLPLNETEKDLWFAGREINETLNRAISETPGPVHINIPLEEPLHDLLDEDLPKVKVIDSVKTQSFLAEKELQHLSEEFNGSEKILILAGQQNPNPKLEEILAEVSEKSGALVLKENLANLNNSEFCGIPDLLITSLLSESSRVFQPDLVITFGGSFVSKPLKQFLRKNKPDAHWHISKANQHADTYQSLTRVIDSTPEIFFEQLLPQLKSKEKTFFENWKNQEKTVANLRDNFVDETKFCDLKVFNKIQKFIPENSVVHLGNSSPVRYALLFEAAKNTRYFSNRGVSGIDGSLSTAVGFASESQKINTIILGDLSFFYDSNALLNKYIGNNLRIIVIHNGGGNIFSMIKGPGESPAFREHFFTENKFSTKGMAQTFGLDYFRAANETDLEKQLTHFYSEKQQKAAVTEIFTDAEVNSKAFRELFKKVKT
ncbi:2-succinyl-5-enolpyruvyl-6-hydroxy-3-cyclohexene-1-carboxylate synthase [Tangfeifania diversioriginum]|uniref:2-succinyl-5-enolpyruvyl-6-hydroxy-3-cyclohexene-1-carboxylate synthase n=1 Tax=Tangfeifania diversioriginum TaxID=1168035 RepID=A0A1M6JIW3_9BACT|nr:2-succinyl-5-enolpyruvyl-6-hydroxy-3-cyclohexene-1-carboxylic-acid synthase [Tangfeifania diversioriginum]SHJ46647.1 2-succinyl-5-enolpyruvyl-6-hydroxy-3-cyclohexene-1-carboxylate synthase [Tangfeifania diversioriginum]